MAQATPTACARAETITNRETVPGQGERLTMGDGSKWLHPFNGGAPVCEMMAEGKGGDLVQEHETSAYDAAKIWHYYESRSDYVASAAWCETVDKSTGFGGPARARVTVRLVAAESNNLAALRRWCADQVAAGADNWRIHVTWPIPDVEAPVRHRLHGKRENAFREGWSKPRD